MNHPVRIAGRSVELEWTNETSKRFAFRMGSIGGEPTPAELTNPRTASTALFKVLWGLLPPLEFARYSDPEALFVATNHEEEAEGIFQGIAAVYSDRFPSEEKKSTSENSHSPELSSV